LDIRINIYAIKGKNINRDRATNTLPGRGIFFNSEIVVIRIEIIRTIRDPRNRK
jgi:hypothetical protein